MSKVNSKRLNPLLLYLILFGSMAISLGELLYPLPAQQKRDVRELEKFSLKLAKSECSLLFNGVCLSENLLPSYSNIYIYIYIGWDEMRKLELVTHEFHVHPTWLHSSDHIFNWKKPIDNLIPTIQWHQLTLSDVRWPPEVPESCFIWRYTSLSRCLVWWRHLDTISERLFSRFGPSCSRISSFSLRQSWHLFVEGL